MPLNLEEQAREIFFGCLRKSTSLERQAFIEAECAGNPAMELAVLDLLQLHDSNGSFLEQPFDDLPYSPENATAAVTSRTKSVIEESGTSIGPYKLLQQIGEGGFGIVYMAQQTEPVRRKVALKVIKPGMDSKEVVARFEAERQALAMMDHPYVAKVLDGGPTESGCPYFVMELVHGTPITKFCDENRLANRQRLALFSDVCRAVQHAHLKGIIHRDIKPSNVLVTMNDDKPMPKVIDFGVSKALSQPLTDKTMFTAYGQMIGTPLYMSPEQTQLSAQDIDVRSDIYSLGVLLYELLTGNTPFDRHLLKKSGFDEMRRIIREVEPPRPSARVSTLQAAALSTVSDQRKVDARKLSRSLSGELDWIVMKALEKDRTRRYESASAFADDIVRHLAGDQVLACPPSLAYRSKKLVSRYRTTVATLSVIFLILLVTSAVSLWKSIEAANARDDAQKQFKREQESRAFAQRRLDSSLALIDAMYSDTRWLSELPNAGEIRQQYIERADVFLDQAEADPDLAYSSPTQIKLAALSRRLADFYYETGKLDDYQAEIERSLGLLQYEETHEILMARAGSLKKLSEHFRVNGKLDLADAKLAEAETAAESALESDINNKKSLFLLFSIRNNRAVMARSRADYEQARQLNQASLILIQRLYELEPDNNSYRLGIAAALHTSSTIAKELDDYETAKQHLLEAITLYPNDASVDLSKQARIFLGNHWYSLGALYAGELDEPKAAIDALQHAAGVREALAADFPPELEHWKSVSDVYNYLGILQKETDLDAAMISYERAIETAKRAVELSPASPSLTRSYCNVLNNKATAISIGAGEEFVAQKKELLDRAVAAGRSCLEAFPKRSDIKEVLGASLCNLALIDVRRDIQVDQAIESLTEATELLREAQTGNPKPTYLINALNALIYCLALHPDPSKRNLKRAQKCLEEIEQLEEKSPKVPSLSALLAVQSGEFERARDLIATKPEDDRDEDDWLVLGIASAKLGDAEMAKVCLQSAENLEPKMNGPSLRLTLELATLLSDGKD